MAKEKKPDFSHADPKFLETVVKSDATGNRSEALTPMERIEAARRLRTEQEARDKETGKKSGQSL